MAVHEQIKGEVKKAMLEKNQVKLSVIRGILSSFTNELVAKKRRPDELLGDEEAIIVIRRLAKQRKDSIEQFRNGGRADLAEAEEAELAHLETYLPKLMNREEIKKLAEAKKAELGVSAKSEAGKLTGALMKELKSKADGADVKAVVDEILI